LRSSIWAWAVIIGMYQRFNDQIGQTAQFMREILAG
jgi:hypothetical protein